MSILVEWVIVDVNESFTIKKRIDNSFLQFKPDTDVARAEKHHNEFGC